MVKIQKKEKYLRYALLAASFALFTIFSLRHFILGGGAAASVDALCPFGGFETLGTLLFTGKFVPMILSSGLVLAFGVLLTAMVFGRGFCGYVCPFGAVQEFLGKILKKKPAIPSKVDQAFSLVKYLVLGVIIAATFFTGTLVFRDYDPFLTFFHFGKGIFWDYSADELMLHLIPFALTLVILAGSVLIERFWCRYLCPLGAVLGLASMAGLTKLERDEKSCNSCKACDRACPARIDISGAEEVKSPECLSCGECITSCPEGALERKVFSQRLPQYSYGLLIVSVLFLVIFSAKAGGIWQSIPIFSEAQGLSPEEVKGWMTLDDISEATGVPAMELILELGLPLHTDPSIPLKEIKNVYGIDFETEAVRDYLRQK